MIPAAVPDLSDGTRALTWARAERANLLACLDHAIGTGEHDRVVALTADLADLLRRDGPWTEAITRHMAAVQAARYLGDRRGQANALNNLRVVRRMTGDYPPAVQVLEQALDIYRDIGDRVGQANALGERGTLYRVSGDLAQAERCHQQALNLARAIASSWHEADALGGLGRCALAVGDTTQAQVLLRQALEIFQRIGAAEARDLIAELDALAGPSPAPSGSSQVG